jgi:hypothetical protein
LSISSGTLWAEAFHLQVVRRPQGFRSKAAPKPELLGTLIEPRQLRFRYFAKFFGCSGTEIQEVPSLGLGVKVKVDMVAPKTVTDDLFRMGVGAPAIATWLLCIAR